jgi:hypothetical protein
MALKLNKIHCCYTARSILAELTGRTEVSCATVLHSLEQRRRRRRKLCAAIGAVTLTPSHGEPREKSALVVQYVAVAPCSDAHLAAQTRLASKYVRYATITVHYVQ